jgi:hypothetical protein
LFNFDTSFIGGHCSTIEAHLLKNCMVLPPSRTWLVARSGSHLQDLVPNPFLGQSQIFASEPSVPLYQLLGRSPQYTIFSPGQATWGKSFCNFLTLSAAIA